MLRLVWSVSNVFDKLALIHDSFVSFDANFLAYFSESIIVGCLKSLKIVQILVQLILFQQHVVNGRSSNNICVVTVNTVLDHVLVIILGNMDMVVAHWFKLHLEKIAVINVMQMLYKFAVVSFISRRRLLAWPAMRTRRCKRTLATPRISSLLPPMHDRCVHGPSVDPSDIIHAVQIFISS